MGYITDVYEGFSRQTGVCPWPNGSFSDGRPICDWSAQFTFQTDPALIPSNQTNFRGQITDLCMDASQKAAFFARVRSDGGDVRVTTSNGKTEIPAYVHYIDKINEKVWISWRESINKNNAVVIKVYVGNPSATAYPVGHALGRNVVFQALDGFFDMAQDPTGTAPQLTDLTGNGNDITMQNSADIRTTLANGMSAYNFDGSNDRGFVDTPGWSGFDTSTITIWANVQSLLAASGTKGIFSFSGANGGDGWIIIGLRRQAGFGDTGTHWDVTGRQTSGGIVRADSVAAAASTGLQQFTVWQQGTGGSGGIKLYVDGTEEARAQWSGTALNNLWFNDLTVTPTLRSAIAESYISGGFAGNNSDDIIGPMMIREAAVSSDLLTTEYNNQNDPASFIPCTTVLFY